MYISDSSDVKLEKNMFTNNVGEQGGALYILHSNVEVKNNHFESNDAESHDNPNNGQSK